MTGNYNNIMQLEEQRDIDMTSISNFNIVIDISTIACTTHRRTPIVDLTVNDEQDRGPNKKYNDDSALQAGKQRKVGFRFGAIFNIMKFHGIRSG